MKSKDILNAMTDVSPDMVEAAAEPAPRRSGAGKRIFLIAACAALLTAAAVTLLLVLNRPQNDIPPETNPTFTDAPTEDPTEAATAGPYVPPHTGGMWVDSRAKKQLSVKTQEFAIELPELPWRLQSMIQQYRTLEYGGATYGSAYEYAGDPVQEGIVSSDYVTDTVTSVDDAGKTHTLGIRIYPLSGDTPARRLFIRFEGNDIWAAYRLQGFDPPATWGELCAGLHLPDLMPFSLFEIPGAAGEDMKRLPTQYFTLSDADSKSFWAMLEGLSDAPEHDDLQLTFEERGEKLCGLLARSSALGIGNLSIQLYDKGWLVTNVEGYGYAFRIGSEAAAELAAFLEAHGTPIDKIPDTKQYTYGTVTESGEGWFKLNDAISLADPSEAVEFTVISNLREVYYSRKWLKPGMTVKVTHEGIYADEPTVIRTVVSVDDVVINGNGEFVVLE